MPLILLSSGQGFTYHTGMRCWMRVADVDTQRNVHSGLLLISPLAQGAHLGEVKKETV